MWRGVRARWRGWRWILRGALILLATIVVGVAGVVIAVHTAWGRDVVRRQIEHQLAAVFVGGGALGGLEGSPFGELTLRDLVIRGPDGTPALSAKTLTLSIGLLALLSHRARIGTVVVEDVEVALRRDANGELAITHLLRPRPASTWSIGLPRVEIRRAHVVFDTGGELINVDDVSLDAQAELPHGGPIDARVELHGRWRERAAAALALDGVVHLDDGGLRVPSLSLRAGEVVVSASQVTIGPRGAGRAPVIGGTLSIDAGAAEVARLIPRVVLPADIALKITATPVPGQAWTQLAIAGRVGGTDVVFGGAADLDASHARGELSTGALELGRLTSGRIDGTAAATLHFDVRPGGPRSLPVATAAIRGWATLAGLPTTTFEIAVSSEGERAHAQVSASGPAVHGTLAATLRIVDARVELEDATLHLATSDPARASGGKLPVHGALNVELAAHGTLRPTPSLALSGTIDGRQLQVSDLSVASMHVALDARRLPDRPLGTARVQLVDLVRGELRLGALTLDAADRTDGKLAVTLRSTPTQSAWLIDLDALVTPLGPLPRLAIELTRHHVRAGAGADWTGRTGRIEIGAERIAVRDLVTTSAASRLAIAGSYDRAGRGKGDLTATVDATQLSLDNFGRAYHGVVDAHVELARRGGAWQGDVALDATRLSIDPVAPAATLPATPAPVVVDAHVRGSLHGRQLTATSELASAGLGRARLALALDAPVAITDPRAWQRLDRNAIRSGELTLAGIELARVAELVGAPGRYQGRIDGTIQLSARAIGGKLVAHDVIAPALHGAEGLNLALDLAQTAQGELAPTLTATIAQLGTVTAQATLVMPDRVLDPAAWAQLGPRVLRRASVRADNIMVDPAMLDRFGMIAELRGRVSGAVEVDDAARAIRASIEVAGLRGTPLVEPIDVRLSAESDDHATTSSLSVKSRQLVLLAASARLPASALQLVRRWRDDPGAVRATPLSATATLVATDAPRLLRVFGRTEVTGGRLDGTAELGGTIATPTLAVHLIASGLTVPPGPRGTPVRTVQWLSVDGHWDGSAARLDIDGVESDGGTLKIAGAVNPGALRDGTLTIRAIKLDLVPLLAFLPGPAGGASGTLDANLTMHGFDLRTTALAGELHLANARVPIAPTVGTLRRAKIDAVIANHEIKLTVDGKLGSGSVTLAGAIALDGASPSGGQAKLTLREVSPIGAVEPKVTADVTATLAHANRQWTADLVVDHALVVVPNDRGEPLKPPGPPADMRFANGERITQRPLLRADPTNPIFVVKIHLRSTRVEADELRGLITGDLEARADGEAIAMFGAIEADRGDLDLFGHRYAVERAAIRFDGSLDPLLDVRITHDFSELTTVTEVHGRVSEPELSLGSDPGSYSQGELLGFLLGGEPNGDQAGGSSTDRLTGAGASLVANKLGGFVRDALPIDINVLRYEAATAATGAAILVGTWITHSLFLAYRQHLASRADENVGEGQLEYWLSRRVVIEATAGDKTDGVDLLWRMRY